MAVIALIVGIFGGLMRLGVPTPTVFSSQAGNHGTFMLSAFFGTVICLERAVALNKPWVYLAPLLSGIGGLAMLVGVPIRPFLAGLADWQCSLEYQSNGHQYFLPAAA